MTRPIVAALRAMRSTPSTAGGGGATHALPPNVTAQLQKDRTKVPDAHPRQAPFRFEQRLRSRFTSCVS
jgi:hypothetical protein